MSEFKIKEDSVEALAEEIRRKHEAANKQVEQTREAVEQGLKSRLQCAALVETAKSTLGQNRFWEFWREQVQLSRDQAKRYLALKKVEGRGVDKRQMVLAGVLDKPEREEQHKARAVDQFAWCRLVGKIRKVLTDEVLDEMDLQQVAVAKSSLEPLARIYIDLVKREKELRAGGERTTLEKVFG